MKAKDRIDELINQAVSRYFDSMKRYENCRQRGDEKHAMYWLGQQTAWETTANNLKTLKKEIE